jgi:uncharacterized small protein (DUF1192 family)
MSAGFAVLAMKQRKKRIAKYKELEERIKKLEEEIERLKKQQ